MVKVGKSLVINSPVILLGVVSSGVVTEDLHVALRRLEVPTVQVVPFVEKVYLPVLEKFSNIMYLPPPYIIGEVLNTPPTLLDVQVIPSVDLIA